MGDGALTFPRPARFALLVLGIALLGVALVLLREAVHGGVFHGDAVNYIGVARRLADGDGFAGFLDRSYVSFPPLFPMLLAAAGFFVVDPQAVAGPLNAACFGLTVVALGWWLRWCGAARPFVALGCLATALAIPLANISALAMSEPPFILLTLLALMLTAAHLSGGGRAAFAWAALFAALACLARFMGVALALAVAPLLLFRRDAPLPERARRLAVWAALAAIPLALWLLRNLSLTGSIGGARSPSGLSASQIRDGMIDVAADWIFLAPPSGGTPAAVTEAAALALLAAGALAVAVAGWRVAESGRARASLATASVFVAVFTACYLFTLATLSGTDSLSRQLLPCIVPAIFLLTLAADRLWRRGARALPVRAAAIAVAGALALWTLGNAGLTAHAIARDDLVSLLPDWSADWRGDFPTVEWFGEPRGAELLSNRHDLLYIALGPANRYQRLPEARDRVERVIDGARPGTWVVWFRDWPANANYGYGSAELRASPALEAVAELPDGVILRVR